MTNNTLTGTLPSQWGTDADVFAELQWLDVSNNSLSGYLPNGWGPGFQVYSLDFPSLCMLATKEGLLCLVRV